VCARTRTLLPLFRKTRAITLGVGGIALATLGVNIGPLLAGARIAGIAVAQCAAPCIFRGLATTIRNGE